MIRKIHASLVRATRRSNALRKDFPDYACVGFPKCATTFILKRFGEHSLDTLVDGEFKMKEFDDHRSRIRELHAEGQRVAIKNPSIIYSRKHMDMLCRANTRIIVSVRNPVRWLKSFYNYRLKRIDQGKESLPKEFDAIPEFREIVDDRVSFMGVSMDRGLMGGIINENLLKSAYFDPCRVHFVIQEEFEASHDKVLDELLDFLEIPDSGRVARDYKFEYSKPQRWTFFNDDDYDQQLYHYYADDMRLLCGLVRKHTGKDLKGIWEKFYSINLD